MRARIRERSFRRPVATDRWSLRPVSRIIGPRPLEFIRRQAWTALPARFSNGISAVTSLCLVDENSAGGPPLLIAGDEDGGVAVQRLPMGCTSTCGTVEEESEEHSKKQEQWPLIPPLRRARLHGSCVNTIKLLPDKRGFVCASDDGVLSAIASLEAESESNLRRATFALHGHSGFVTDCDTAACGHAILSSSTDGRMLLWDPVASNTPVTSVAVGRAVNSACFSTGDPYAIICAPERFGFRSNGNISSSVGGASDELVQIWDLRSLRCFRDTIPAAVAEAFGEPEPMSQGLPEPKSTLMSSMQPPPSQALPNSTDYGHGRCNGFGATRSGTVTNSTPARLPWLASVGSFSHESSSNVVESPLTALVRLSTWTSDSSDNEFSSPWGSGSTWSRVSDLQDTAGRENTTNPYHTSTSPRSTADADDGRGSVDWTKATPVPTKRSRSSNENLSPGSCGTNRGARGRRLSHPEAARETIGDGPVAFCCQADIPEDSRCLHTGLEGKSWVPGGSVTWQPGKRRARRIEADTGARGTFPFPGLARPLSYSSKSSSCRTCCDDNASVYSVQVTSDGRGILTASRDSTITLWNAQTRKVVHRFGHPRLSVRARPILSGLAASGDEPRWSRGDSRFEQGYSCGEVFAGTTGGEVRAWKLGSRFPHRVFKPARHHDGFEVTCVAGNRDGAMFASADSSGKICVQSATTGGRNFDS